MKLIVCLAVLAVGSISATPLLGNLNLGKTFGGIINTVNGAVTSVIDVIGNLSRALDGIVANVQGVVGQLNGNLLAVAQQLIAAITAALDEIVAQIQGLTPLCGCGGLPDVVGGLVGNVETTLNGVVAAVGGILANVTGNVYELAQLDGLLNNLICAVYDLLATSVAAVDELLSQVSAEVDVALAELQLVLLSVFQIVGKTLSGLLADLQTFNDTSLHSLLDGALGNVSVFVNDLSGEIGTLAKAIVEDVRKAIASLSPTLNQILATLQGSLGSLGLECPF